MKKKIGILGGISHTSTIKYYQTMMKLYYERFGNYYYPETGILLLDSLKLHCEMALNYALCDKNLPGGSSNMEETIDPELTVESSWKAK